MRFKVGDRVLYTEAGETLDAGTVRDVSRYLKPYQVEWDENPNTLNWYSEDELVPFDD